MCSTKEIQDIEDKIRAFKLKDLKTYIESKEGGYRVDDWRGERCFVAYYESMIEKVWLDEKRISCEYLNVYDRYILEFECLLYNPNHSMFAPAFNFRVFDKDLDTVYDLRKRMYDVDSKDMYKRLWELEYWLSLDWKVDGDGNV